MNAITFRLAKPDDLDDIVNLSQGIYEGHDYLPLKFHKWLQLNNMAVILAHSGDKLIGLLACFIVDDGRTLVRRAERIRQELRGQGLVKQLREYARNHAKQHFPNLQRVRFTTVFDIVNSQHHTKLLDWDIVGYQVEKKFCSRALASTANSVEIKPCSREYFSNIILSSPVRRKLFQDDVILVNWCPFEPLRSNIDHMLQDRNEFFAEKCADDAFPRSFSFGTFLPTVKFVDWQVVVYANDPVLFEAHLLHQLKRACEFVSSDFIFVSFHDKSLTELTKKLMEEQLQLKKDDEFSDKMIKLYEIDLTS